MGREARISENYFRKLRYLLVALTDAVIADMRQSRLDTNLRMSVYETVKAKGLRLSPDGRAIPRLTH